jgi:predicted deacylase
VTGFQRRTIGGPGAPTLTVHEVGDADLPLVVVLGGVHGDEPEGMLVAHSLVARPPTLRGVRLRVVTVANPSAYDAGTRVSAIDQANLARSFPGDRRGSWTERLAHLLTTEVLAGADVLIDVHSAGLHFAMPLLAGALSTGPLGARAIDVGRALGLPFLWHHPEIAPGRTLSAAETLGVAPIYIEMPGGPTADMEIVGRVRRGLDAYLGGSSAPAGLTREVEGSGDLDQEVLRSHADGLFLPGVRAGDLVGAGMPIGQILDPLEPSAAPVEVTAPVSGHIMMLRRTARVPLGTALASFGVPTA